MIAFDDDRPWQDSSDSFDAPPGNVLLRTVYIYGTPHHANAIRVRENDDGAQETYNEVLKDEFDTWYQVYTGDAWATTQIPGFEGEFVILIHPHGD